MLVLSNDSIKDFQTCERLYDYRYNDDSPEKVYSRDIYTIRFESTIKSILYYFWYKKQAGVTPSYSSLLNRWEKLWFPKDMDSYDIITEQHESAYGNVASLTSKAAAILMNFHEKYSTMDIIPIAISENYSAIINRNVRIEDKFDLIYRDGSKNYVVKFLFNYKNSNRYMYQVDFSSMYCGFINRHSDRIKETQFGYIDFMSNSLDFVSYKVSSEDIDSLTYWCENISATEVFVPRRNLTPYCKKCPYDEPCSKWSGWK